MLLYVSTAHLSFGEHDWEANENVQLAWLIAFVSSVISDVKETYPNFAWWALVYMFWCIIGVLITVASDAEQTYNVAVGAFQNHAICFGD